MGTIAENLKQFLLYIESKYKVEEQLIIKNFMSYYMNEYNGYGKQNSKQTYKDNLIRDTTGELHRLALIGFEFEKRICS